MRRRTFALTVYALDNELLGALVTQQQLFVQFVRDLVHECGRGIVAHTQAQRPHAVQHRVADLAVQPVQVHHLTCCGNHDMAEQRGRSQWNEQSAGDGHQPLVEVDRMLVSRQRRLARNDKQRNPTRRHCAG